MRAAMEGGGAGRLETASRVRKDPWVRRRVLIQGPTGRPRLDPQRLGAGLDTLAQDGPREDLNPLRVVDEPSFLVAAVLPQVRNRLTNGERSLLGIALKLAGEGGATLACLPTEMAELSDAGADRVLAISTLVTYWPDAAAAVLQDKILDGTVRHVVLPDDTDGRHIALRLAAALDLPCALGVLESPASVVRRRAYGESIDLSMPIPPVMTVSEGVGRPVSGQRFEARKIDVNLGSIGVPPIKDLGFISQVADQIELEEAPFILSGGAGISDWKSFERVAEKLNATRAGTRVVCDAGHLPRERQVGASGRLVSADCYVALGLSGAVQHLQGIENCANVIAVNSDAHAPIVKRADLTFVTDVDAVLSALLSQLESRS